MLMGHCALLHITILADFQRKLNMAVRKRGKSWSARINWRDANGQLHQMEKGGFKTKVEAEQYSVEQQYLHTKGVDIESNPVFADYFHEWWTTFKKPHIRHETQKRYETNDKIIHQYLDDVKIKRIKRLNWQQFINDVCKTRSTTTVRLLNRQFRACVKNAVADGLITLDFTQGVNINGNDANTRKPVFLSYAEAQTLLRTAMDDRDPTVPSTYIIIAIILTGARVGEISALKWHNLDIKKHTIAIHHSYNSDIKELGPTKNTASYRTIRINTKLIDLLQEIKIDSKDGYIFQEAATGLPPANRTINSKLQVIMRHAKLDKKDFTIHSLRHVHVAILHHKSVDWMAISKRLGHQNLSMTLSVYAYYIDEDKRKSDKEIEKKLDDLFI